MPHMLIRIKIEDYAKWKPIFDQHAAVRKANGSKGGVLFRNADNSNEITVLLEWDNLGNAKKFAQSCREDLMKTMHRAGLIGKPDIYFLEEIERTPA